MFMEVMGVWRKVLGSNKGWSKKERVGLNKIGWVYKKN